MASQQNSEWTNDPRFWIVEQFDKNSQKAEETKTIEHEEQEVNKSCVVMIVIWQIQAYGQSNQERVKTSKPKE